MMSNLSVLQDLADVPRGTDIRMTYEFLGIIVIETCLTQNHGCIGVTKLVCGDVKTS